MNVVRLTRIAVAVSAALVLGVPAAAAAQEQPGRCLPNESVAVLDQYCDALVAPSGSSEPIGSDADGKPLSKVLPAKEVAQLHKAGRAGKALLTLAVSTTVIPGSGAPPAQVRRKMAEARRAVEPQKLKPPAADVVSISRGVVSVSADVLGGAFRWGLVICTLGLAGMTWLRFRTRIKL